jgi:hypothetical protein
MIRPRSLLKAFVHITPRVPQSRHHSEAAAVYPRAAGRTSCCGFNLPDFGKASVAHETLDLPSTDGVTPLGKRPA